jgi:hypothetical protein
MDVKVRIYDRIHKTETNEVVTVDADSGDAAAEAALALRPNGNVVGVAPKGGLSPAGGTVMEGDDDVPQPDDEDSEPGPSNRERAAMGLRTMGLPQMAQRVESGSGPDFVEHPPKRGPGRPRKEPQT